MATYSQKCSSVGGYSYATNFTLYIELTETSVDTTNNTSKIKYNVYCKSSGSGSISARHYEYFKLNGQTIIDETVSVSASSPNANIPIASGTTSAIAHNSDGTKSVSFEAEIDAASYGVSASKSGTFSLSTIPRKSTVSATTANIGANSTITIKRASSSFTHTLTYTFGSLSGTIATKTGSTSVSWTLPDSFYGQIPNAKSKTGTITCTTYNGNTSLGSNTCSFTANAVESVARPTVTATVTDINSTTTALTGDDTKIVLNASTARIVITSGLRKNAGSISSVKINNVNVGTSTSITKDYSNVTTGTFTIVTTDSRGFSTTITLSPTTVNYVPLTLKAQVFRPSPTSGEVALTYSGNYFNGSFGNESNTLTAIYQYKLNTDSTYTTGTVDISPIISGNTYSKNNISLGDIFTYTNAYNFIITVTDKIKSVSFSTIVNRGKPVFYWGEDFLSVSQAIRIPKNGATGWGLCNSDGVSIIRDHNNANVTVDATGETLFLGYQSTTGLNILNGKINITSSGHMNFNDGNNNCCIGANGGAILLRPNGADNTSGQITLSSDGQTWVNGNINFNGEQFLKGYSNGVYVNLLRAGNGGMCCLGDSSRVTGIWGSYVLIQTSNIRFTGFGADVNAISGSDNILYLGNGGGASGKSTYLRGNTVRLYSHEGTVYLGSSGSTAVTSDEQVKELFDINDKYIDFYNNLKPTLYKYTTPTGGNRLHIGFGARQVEKSLKDAGLTNDDFAGIVRDENVDICEDEWGEKGGKHFDVLYSLKYEEFIALNTKMIQKTIQENDELKTKITNLESRLTVLENI